MYICLFFNIILITGWMDGFYMDTRNYQVFARPFIGAMDGHIDAISCMAKNPTHLKGFFSGSMDGDIRLWDIASRSYSLLIIISTALYII